MRGLTGRSDGWTQHGLALVAVLWMVFALALMLSGLLGGLRTEIRQTADEKQHLLMKAQSQAGMFMALQRLASTPSGDLSDMPRVMEFEFNERPVVVRMRSLNGLIDLNNAPVELLTALFRYGAGVEQGLAEQMAQELARIRQADGLGESPAFESVEDLMRLDSFRYEYFVSLAGLVTADVKMGSGRVNPRFAPLGVLMVLTAGDEQLAREIAARQEDQGALLDTSRLPPAFVEREVSEAFVLESRLAMPDGASYQLSWVVHQAIDPYSGLPWRVVRSSSRRLPL